MVPEDPMKNQGKSRVTLCLQSGTETRNQNATLLGKGEELELVREVGLTCTHSSGTKLWTGVGKGVFSGVAQAVLMKLLPTLKKAVDDDDDDNCHNYKHSYD